MFQWTPLVGVRRYVFEFTGPGGQFTIPNATTLTDPGAVGRVPLTEASFPVIVPAQAAPGTYQVRVIALAAHGLPLGSFSDALSVDLQ